METLDQVFQVTETLLAASAAINALLWKRDRKLNMFAFYLLCNLFMQRMSTTVQNVFKSIKKIKVLIDFLHGLGFFLSKQHIAGIWHTEMVNKWNATWRKDYW